MQCWHVPVKAEFGNCLAVALVVSYSEYHEVCTKFASVLFVGVICIKYSCATCCGPWY